MSLSPIRVVLSPFGVWDKYVFFLLVRVSTSFLLLSSRDKDLVGVDAEPGRVLPERGAPFVTNRDSLSLRSATSSCWLLKSACNQGGGEFPEIKCLYWPPGDPGP